MVAGKRSTMIVGAALLTGGVLRSWNSDQSFWWDEIWSTMTYVKAQSLWKVVSSLGYYFNNHILYSLLARAFVAVLGESELVARATCSAYGTPCYCRTVLSSGRHFWGDPPAALPHSSSPVPPFTLTTLQRRGVIQGSSFFRSCLHTILSRG